MCLLAAKVLGFAAATGRHESFSHCKAMSTSLPDPSDPPEIPPELPRELPANAFAPDVVLVSSRTFSESLVADNYEQTLAEAQAASDHRRARYRAWKRKQLIRSLFLFILTFISTWLVGGPSYAVPVMLILFCHEMGHYLQSVRYRVPASLPYFIPMPLTPLGTMGAVIFQGHGIATRRQMFDIAVSGPLAGLAVTFPVLWIGLQGSTYAPLPRGQFLEYGDPLIITWIMELIHGPLPAGQGMFLIPMAFAGWVGVMLTAINLLPVGQLDGGHIAYTLLGRRAHTLALLTVAAAAGMIIFQQNYSFVLLVILMLLTGIRHPPTADDSESLGWFRHVIGWLTLSFLVVGLTPNPMMIRDTESDSSTRSPRTPPAIESAAEGDLI